MTLFGRRRRREDATGTAEVGSTATDPDDAEFVDDLDEQDRAYEDALLLAELDAQEQPAAAAAPPRPQGPWDAADLPADDVQRLDMGGMRIPVPEGMEVRIDVSPEGDVVAATLVHGAGQVQVNAFAAPRSEGIWPEVLAEIAESLTGSGGAAEQIEGPYGPELRAAVPTEIQDRGVVLAPARFVGVDGPRWFLRALYTGAAAVDPAAAASLEAAVRDVVVVRGTDPMAVRDALPLRLPAQAEQAMAEAGEGPAGQGPDGQDGDDQDGDGPDLTMPVRGPEITETR